VSSPSDRQPSVAPVGPAQPSTQEIPVVQPAGATAVGDGAVQVPVDAVQPTGPVDFVPGLPGVGTPPSARAAAAPPPPPPVPPVAVPADTSDQHTTEAVAPVWPDTLESGAAPAGSGKRRARAPRDRAAALGLGLAVLSLALLEVGLLLDFGTESYWSAVPLWSAFATVCGVLGVLAFAATYPSRSRLRSNAVWRIAAAGLVGLAVFWILVVLPVVASDRGFLLTAALGALGAALWVGPGRKN
jgi:hypothetical protein